MAREITERRRAKQDAFNREHGIVPKTIVKAIPDSIEISIDFNDDVILLRCSFRFGEESETRKLNVVIGAVSVEVIAA